MGNQRKYEVVHLVNNSKSLKRVVAKPTFVTCKIFNDNLVAAQCKQTKPIYVGQAVLDLSKELMYHFYYNYLFARYGTKYNLLMTDTDSFLYEIRAESQTCTWA